MRSSYLSKTTKCCHPIINLGLGKRSCLSNPSASCARCTATHCNTLQRMVGAMQHIDSCVEWYETLVSFFFHSFFGSETSTLSHRTQGRVVVGTTIFSSRVQFGKLTVGIPRTRRLRVSANHASSLRLDTPFSLLKFFLVDSIHKLYSKKLGEK